MPRLKTRSIRDPSPITLSALDSAYDLPDIADDDAFRVVAKKLSFFFVDVIELPSTFEQLRTTAAGECLQVLVNHLGDTCTNPSIVHALLALKWHYSTDDEHRGLSDARANACEIVAWRFLARLSERDAVDYCLYEIPSPAEPASENVDSQAPTETGNDDGIDLEHADGRRDEFTALLLPHNYHAIGRRPPRGTASPLASLPRAVAHLKRSELISSVSRLTTSSLDEERLAVAVDPAVPFTGLNALEIAAIASAKRFLGQHVVQMIITGIWNGDILFWDGLSVDATKRPRFYNSHSPPDPFSRLRVPKYIKFWEVVFFAVFLVLYYGVLVEQSEYRITATEVGLYVWLAAFMYDELSEWNDAGSIFYTTDLWNLFDMIMIAIGFAFAILRVIGISQQNPKVIDIAYDVLALEALFMMPRICSLLSLSPYWGTLIPCLKEMGKDFVKFMVLIIIIYLGFLTTFCLIGRDSFSTRVMTWKMTMIFFGSNYIGFEMMDKIDQFFGPPLMIMFITLSSILLTGSMTGMLSNSFSRVIKHARDEYLYVYSVYVLEASTSNRLTHFYPPFNLVALVVFRPLRYACYSRRSAAGDHRFRAARILLLKMTHLPIVAAIGLYEMMVRRASDDEFAGFKGPKLGGERVAHQRRTTPRGRSRPSSAANAANRPPLPPSKALDNQRQLSVPPSPRGFEDEGMDEPTLAEARIEELHRKIDQLTSLVLAIQEVRELERDERRGREMEG